VRKPEPAPAQGHHGVCPRGTATAGHADIAGHPSIQATSPGSYSPAMVLSTRWPVEVLVISGIEPGVEAVQTERELGRRPLISSHTVRARRMAVCMGRSRPRRRPRR